jgi:hypothetical protein
VRAEIEKFVAELQKSLQNSTFVKLTLSNYKGDEEHLQKIAIRQIETKKGRRLAFQAKYATREVVKNFDLGAGAERVRKHIENGFRSGHLFTTENDFQLTVGKRSARLVKGKASFRTAPSVSHDRIKKDLIDPSAYYLTALGITTDNGEVRADQRDKWKQINKFVEILAGLIENSLLKDTTNLRIVDMGSGKGYLTFALYDYIVCNSSPPYKGGVAEALRGRGGSLGKLEVIGVEQRRELVALCNDIARASGFAGLKFVEGTIADFDPGKVDILIALHACDTATDDALYKGVKAGAEIIVAAPCCHHELKKQLKSPELLAGILKHPVMLERTAETLTDGIRSMLLEANGYKTKMFEFVATEHTPKNNMLVAVKAEHRRDPAAIKANIRQVKEQFGIAPHRLDDLLAASAPAVQS